MCLALGRLHHREASLGLFLLAQCSSLRKFRAAWEHFPSYLPLCLGTASQICFTNPNTVQLGCQQFAGKSVNEALGRAWDCFPRDLIPSRAEPFFAASHLPLESTGTFGDLSHWILLPCFNARRLESDQIHTKQNKPDQQQQKELVQTPMKRWQSKRDWFYSQAIFFKELDNVKSSQTNSVNNWNLSTCCWRKSSS